MKKINRVIIIGIDALDYNLVEKWNLKNLKQREYGKNILPIYPGEEPNTRIIWPCFITGQMPAEMGYVTGRIFKQPIQSVINLFLPKVKFFLNPQREELSDYQSREKSKRAVFTTNIYSFLNKMNIVRLPEKKDIKSLTMFDTIEKSFHNHIPIYDEYIPSYASRVIEAIENKNYRSIFQLQCREEFRNRTNEVFTNIKKIYDFNVYMQYFWCLDGIQHVFFNNQRKIAEFYIMFDEFISKINEMIDDTTLLLIISDHGQKNGIHTPYGYYSVNKNLGLKNPKLIDFRWKIQDLLSEHQ